MSEQRSQKRRPSNKRRRLQWGLLGLILLIAAGLRLWDLNSVPPGFTHDEAGHGHDAVTILHGARPIYQTVGYGREPLYDYMVAGLMGLLGPNGQTLRLASALFGLATLGLSFAWVRCAFDTPTALLALAFQAASFWSLSTGRQALRSGLLPALFSAAAYLYWRQLKGQGSAWPTGLFGLLIGASLYTYMPARALWAVFAVFLAYLALFHRPIFGRVWRPTLLGLALGLALALPLFAYLHAHPGAEQRLDMLDAPLQAMGQGDLAPALDRARSALSGLLLPGQGDDFLAYTLPGRPILDPLTGGLCLLGLGLCLARWRRPAPAFALLWLLAGLAPTLITGASASSTRSVGALPVLFLFPALAVVTGARWVRARWGPRAAWTLGAGAALLIGVTGARSAYDYFVTWGQSPHVRAAYRHTLVEMARYADARPLDGVLAVSTLRPQPPHDPYVWQISLEQADGPLSPFTPPPHPAASPATRWFDASRSLVIPSRPADWLIAPASAPLAPYFADLPGLEQVQTVTLRPDDLVPSFSLYAWQPALSLTALEERLQGQPLDLSLPVDLGPLRFLGYDLRTPRLPPGGSVELVTLWQAVDPRALRPDDLSDAGAEWVLFSHALDPNNQVVGQEDRLSAPVWSWQAGDVVAQIHRFSLPADLAPGPLSLEIGLYHRADLSRLPVRVDGAVVADRILLPPLEVIAP